MTKASSSPLPEPSRRTGTGPSSKSPTLSDRILKVEVGSALNWLDCSRLVAGRKGGRRRQPDFDQPEVMDVRTTDELVVCIPMMLVTTILRIYVWRRPTHQVAGCCASDCRVNLWLPSQQPHRLLDKHIADNFADADMLVVATQAVLIG
jgi:hypothetical protein